MFDIFGKKKIKELEEDIKTLYGLYESEVFDSFVTNFDEIISAYQIEQCYSCLREIPEKKYEDITVKTVVGMILKKMGLKISYTSKKEKVVKIPSEFKLVKRG